jgi:hypothetical protein
MPCRVTTEKRPRKAAATAKKPRRSTTKTATTRPRTRKAAPPPEAVEPAVLEPAGPIEVDVPAPPADPGPGDTVIVTGVPEPGFVGRVPPPEPAPPRPAHRRGVFFDVENTSRAADISRVVSHLALDWQGWTTEFLAVGNWRVIGHDTARLLAQHGAALVHSAPSVGVRDWSDLRIAVSAGVWLAGARPGDVIEIVSDDQAFDAVGDVAASLGVTFRRTSYRALAGAEGIVPVPAGESRQRRSRRGGRRRGERRPVAEAPRTHSPAPPRSQHAPPHVAAAAEPHTAPHDEIVGVVRDLLATSPGGVSLDALANSLRERGFSRPPGSPRLITRLRRIKELDVSRIGTIRLMAEGAPAAAATVSLAPAIEPEGELVDGTVVDPGQPESSLDELPPAEVSDDLEAAEETPPADGDEGAAAPDAPRRRRRRGGRRRRGRRGGVATAVAAPDGASG